MENKVKYIMYNPAVSNGTANEIEVIGEDNCSFQVIHNERICKKIEQLDALLNIEVKEYRVGGKIKIKDSADTFYYNRDLFRRGFALVKLVGTITIDIEKNNNNEVNMISILCKDIFNKIKDIVEHKEEDR